ncbi:MAG: aldehyde ferredoxin oxidoreductase family protein [Thermodesulfovibrionales bacterium]|nr:aldehyde ferredoxin oxidoreductase family protein [Thermodesulfovibrionales bacterium]
MRGYTGKGLVINLSKSEIFMQKISSDQYEQFIGGRGIGVSLMSDYIKYEYDSPEIPIIFATGPLTATAAITSGRSSVITKSPLTGTIFDSSVGGHFGKSLKKAGYDFIKIFGISKTWVIIEIKNDEVNILDARKLEGKNISELIPLKEKGFSFAGIGIAGEKKVKFSSIVIDGYYCAGRGGLGAVLGAKKLKGIFIWGDKEVIISDLKRLKNVNSKIIRLLRASPAIFGEFGISEFGTAAFVDLIHARRLEPTDNFRKTYFPYSYNYSAYRLKKTFKYKKTGCSGCPILCKKIGTNGIKIPEYETLSHFGALNNCSDLSTIIEANEICNDYGIDTISAASTIACFSEINSLRTNPDDIKKTLINICLRNGIGDALAEGSLRYAQSVGCPELSISVKGLELPAYDPRGAYGLALAYATSSRGGCHLRAYPISHEILRKPISTDRFSFEGKARIIKISEDLNAVIDSLIACKFVFLAATLHEYCEALNAVTGANFDLQRLLKIGEKICNLERQLNKSLGFNEYHDDLPKRFFTEEGSSDDKVKVLPIDRNEFLQAKKNYYKIRDIK